MASPSEKHSGSKRLAFDVTIPDHLLYQMDVILPEISKVEEIEGPGQLNSLVNRDYETSRRGGDPG